MALTDDQARFFLGIMPDADGSIDRRDCAMFLRVYPGINDIVFLTMKGVRFLYDIGGGAYRLLKREIVA